jgi:hypothetical protein
MWRPADGAPYRCAAVCQDTGRERDASLVQANYKPQKQESPLGAAGVLERLRRTDEQMTVVGAQVQYWRHPFQCLAAQA